MHALKADAAPALEDLGSLRSLRQRAVSGSISVQAERATATFSDDDRDASALLALLADALERIAEETTDASAKEIRGRADPLPGSLALRRDSPRAEGDGRDAVRSISPPPEGNALQSYFAK